MRKEFLVLLIAVLALAGFSKKNNSVRSAKITYIKVSGWPQKNAKGEAWDEDSAPDVYMQLTTKNDPQWTVTSTDPGNGGSTRKGGKGKQGEPAAAIADGGRGGNGGLLGSELAGGRRDEIPTLANDGGAARVSGSSGKGGKGRFFQVANDPFDDVVFENATNSIRKVNETPYLVEQTNTTYYIQLMDKDKSDADDFMGRVGFNLSEYYDQPAVIFRKQNGITAEIGIKWE